VIIKALANLRKNGRIEKNEGLVSEMVEFDKKMAEFQTNGTVSNENFENKWMLMKTNGRVPS
jgi:hypothetical protein